jgi:hypothetical protein
MLLHTEVSIVIDADIPAGVIMQSLFEHRIASKLNLQRELNFVTFWDLDAREQCELDLPIVVEIISDTRFAQKVVYSAPIRSALTYAIPLSYSHMLVRLTWVGKRSIMAHALRLNLRMDIDVRRKNSSFSHINRYPELPDSTSLSPGESHVLTKI